MVPRSEHATRLKATTSWSGRFPRRRTSSPCASTRTWAGSDRAFARFTKTTYENTSSGSVTPDVGDNLFVQNTKNWQVSHTWPIKSNVVNVFRVGRVEALANQEGIGCPQADLDFLGLTGVFSNIPDPQRGCPGVGMQGYARAGGRRQRLHGQQSTHVGRQQHDHVGERAITRSTSARTTAGGRSRETRPPTSSATSGTSTSASPETSFADFLLGYYGGASVFQPGPFAGTGAGGQPLRVQLDVLRPVHPGRLEGELQAHPEPGPPLRLPQRALRDERPHGLAKPRLRAGRPARGRRELAAEGVVDGAYYQEAGRRSPENPDRYKVFAPRLSFAYRPDRVRGTRSSGAATGSSTTPRSYARSTAPRVSIRMSAANNYPQTLGQTAPLQTTDQLFPSFTGGGVATPAFNTLPRREPVSGAQEPEGPPVVSRNPAAALAVHHRGAELRRRPRGQPLDADQHRPGPALHTQTTPPFSGAGRSPTSPPRSTASWSGFSDYHALNATLTHRGRGLLTSVAYTWSKSTDSKSSAAALGANESAGWQGFLNNHDVARDHGLSGFDVAHRVSASFVWNLPFGKGERLRRQRLRREERDHRRLAGERDLPLAGRLPHLDIRRRRGRRPRHLRHQPGQHRGRHPLGRRHGRAVVQQGGLRPAGARANSATPAAASCEGPARTAWTSASSRTSSSRRTRRCSSAWRPSTPSTIRSS